MMHPLCRFLFLLVGLLTAASTTSTTAFTEMAEQLQKTVVSPRQQQRQQAPAAQLDPQKYVATMQQLMQNPQFVAMAEQLGSALLQDPAVSTMLGGSPTRRTRSSWRPASRA